MQVKIEGDNIIITIPKNQLHYQGEVNLNSDWTGKDIYERFEKFHDFKDFVEREFILHRLNKNNWNVSKTAEELYIQRSHLYNKIEKYNLKRD